MTQYYIDHPLDILTYFGKTPGVGLIPASFRFDDTTIAKLRSLEADRKPNSRKITSIKAMSDRLGTTNYTLPANNSHFAWTITTTSNPVSEAQSFLLYDWAMKSAGAQSIGASPSLVSPTLGLLPGCGGPSPIPFLRRGSCNVSTALVFRTAEPPIVPSDGNMANYGLVTSEKTFSEPLRVTSDGMSDDAGQSAYGTFGQEGNAYEWNDLEGTAARVTMRGLRGGYWGSDSNMIGSQSRLEELPGSKAPRGGFRYASSQEISENMVAVGDANNIADANGRGRVDHPYYISKYQLTIGEYVLFLNSVLGGGRVAVSPQITNIFLPNTNSMISCLLSEPEEYGLYSPVVLGGVSSVVNILIRKSLVNSNGLLGFEYVLWYSIRASGTFSPSAGIFTNLDARVQSISVQELKNIMSKGTAQCDGSLLSDNSIQGVAYLPALNLSWFDCARYANWKSNGSKQSLTGLPDKTTTEDGAYTLVNGRTTGNAVAKNATNPNTPLLAPTCWIPTEDEWYKAAYYKGAGVNTGYWKYATQNDSPPRKPLNLSTSCVGISIKEPQRLTPALTTPSDYVIDLGENRNFNMACYDASPVASLSQTNSIATTTRIRLDKSIDGQPHAGDDNKWVEVHDFIDVGQVNQGVRVVDGTTTRDASLIDGGIPDIKVFNSTSARYIRLRLYNTLGTTVCLSGFRLFLVDSFASDPNAMSSELNSNTRSLSLNITNNNINYLLAHEYNKVIGDTSSISSTYPGANFLTNVGTNGGPSSYGTYGQGDYPNELIGDGSLSNIFSASEVLLDQSKRTKYLPSNYCTYAGFGLRLASSVPDDLSLINKKIIEDSNDIINTLPTNSNSVLLKSLDVKYDYYIQQYKTTLRDYTAFLNAIAKSDPNDLSTSGLGSMASRGGSLGAIVRSGTNNNWTYEVVRAGDLLPITRLRWVDCARYANWMSNGQPTGDQTSQTTENGAYNLSGIRPGGSVGKNTENPNTPLLAPTYWIPTLAEWLKAGFYKGTANKITNPSQAVLAYYYHEFATTSSVTPGHIDMVLPNKNGARKANIKTNVYNPSVSVGAWTIVSAVDTDWVGTISAEDLIAPPPPPATPTKSPNTTPRSTRNFVLCPDPTPTPTPAAGLIDGHIRCPFSLTLSGLTPGRRYISEAHIYDINSEISKIIPPSITFRAQSNGIQHLSFIAYRDKNTNRSVITIETQSPGNPTDRDTSSVVLDISLEDPQEGSCQVPCIEYPCPTPTPASPVDNLATTINYSNGAIWNNQIGNVSTVGTNGVSSTYGTFDQNGNVWEWLETGDHLNVRYLRGGSYSSQGYELQSRNTSGRKKAPMTSYSSDKGFRIASYTNPYNFQPTCFIIINDSCNIADSNGLGATPYVYHMSKYEVTNKEYVEFLNTQAYFLESKFLDSFKSEMSSSPLGGIIRILCKDRYTYSTKTNMRFKPVNFVSWIDATRYCNWLHNNKTLEDIQTGAYQLKNPNLARTSDAKYFLPTENEWYKAAYYDPNMNENKNRYYPGIYSLYATASNKLPTPVTVNPSGVGPFASDLSCLYDAVVLKDIIRQDCDTCTEQIISLELEGNNSCFSEVEYRLANNNTGVGIGTEWTKLPTDGVPDSLARYGCSDGPPSRFYTPISHKFTGRGDPDAQYVKQSLWVRTGDTWNTQGKFPCGISYQYSMTVHSITNPCNVSSTGYFSYDGSISCCEGAAVANPAFSTGSLVNPNELPGFVLEYTNCDKCPPGCYNTETVTC